MINILLVDDSAPVLELLCLIFVEYGCRVSCALSGNQALKIIDNSQFDIIISDYEMADGDGLFLYNEIQSQFPVPDFFLFSAVGGQLKDICNSAGIKKFYNKDSELNKLVADVIAARGLTRELKRQP